MQQKELIGGGTECDVYRISGDVVYKQFLDGDCPKKAFERSCEAYELGFGPRTWGLTEKGFFQEYMPSLEDMCIDFNYNKYFILVAKMRENDFLPIETELHDANIAEDQNGDYVCLDFGDISSQLRGIENVVSDTN